jgi:hypothetical protein
VASLLATALRLVKPQRQQRMAQDPASPSASLTTASKLPASAALRWSVRHPMATQAPDYDMSDALAGCSSDDNAEPPSVSERPLQ